MNLLTPICNNTTKGISWSILKCSSLGERIEKIRSQQQFHTNVLSFAKHSDGLGPSFQQFSEGMVMLYLMWSERHRRRQLTKPRSPDSQTPCFYHIQEQEGTSGLYHKRLGISATYLKTNPWSRCPCDHNGGLSDLRVVRWNGAQRLHCERESMHVFKSWNHRRWHRMYREPQFTQLVDPECHNLHWVGIWSRSMLPNLSCATQIIWHLAKTQGQCGARSLHFCDADAASPWIILQ